MSFAAEALVSIKRVEEYLLLEEQEKSSLALHHNEIELVDPNCKTFEKYRRNHTSLSFQY